MDKYSTISESSRVVQIEGVRALCVILVLLFHVDPDWLPAGYLGVDAFFAVSGYVITRMIARQVRQGAFTFRQFYISRAIRLLPAMLVTVLLSYAVFFTLYSMSDLRALFLSGLSATFSVSNIFFFFDAGYFSTSSIYKPLLHTWSLGVEEQFYLIWPLFLVFVIRLKVANAWIMAALAAFLFAATMLASKQNSDLTFFITPFRMYQFAAGAAAYFLASRLTLPTPPLLIGAFSVALVAAMLTLALPDYAPGTHQTIAQAAMTLIVALACWIFDISEKYSQAPDSTILGNRLLVFLGSRSYAIYLAHWPVVLAAHAIMNGLGNQAVVLKLGILAVSIGAGILLAESIERPLRLKRDTSPKTQRLRLAIVGGMIGFSAAVAIVGATTIYFRLESEPVVTAAKTLNAQFAAFEDSLCSLDVGMNDAPLDITDCLSPDQKNVLVVGDSLSRHVTIGLKLRFPDVNFIRIFRAGCPPYFGSNEEAIQRMTDRLERCRHDSGFVWSFVINQIQQIARRVDGLVVAGNWYGRNLEDNRLYENLPALEQLGMPVAIVGPVPFYSDDIRRLYEEGKIDLVSKTDLSAFRPETGYGSGQLEIDAKMKAETERFRNVSYIEIYSILCPDICPAFFDNQLVVLDQMHPTMAGIRKIVLAGVYDGFIENLPTTAL